MMPFVTGIALDFGKHAFSLPGVRFKDQLHLLHPNCQTLQLWVVLFHACHQF